MNFRFTLTKTESSLVQVLVSGINGKINLVAPTTIISVDLPTPCELFVQRQDEDLYQTNKTCHDNRVIVESILIDNFWTIDKRNHWSVTEFDADYIEHVQKYQGTWELKNTLNNDSLYFNGKLVYSITSPIRSMYFK